MHCDGKARSLSVFGDFLAVLQLEHKKEVSMQNGTHFNSTCGSIPPAGQHPSLTSFVRGRRMILLGVVLVESQLLGRVHR